MEIISKNNIARVATDVTHPEVLYFKLIFLYLLNTLGTVRQYPKRKFPKEYNSEEAL